MLLGRSAYDNFDEVEWVVDLSSRIKSALESSPKSRSPVPASHGVSPRASEKRLRLPRPSREFEELQQRIKRRKHEDTVSFTDSHLADQSLISVTTEDDNASARSVAADGQRLLSAEQWAKQAQSEFEKRQARQVSTAAVNPPPAASPEQDKSNPVVERAKMTADSIRELFAGGGIESEDGESIDMASFADSAEHMPASSSGAPSSLFESFKSHDGAVDIDAILRHRAELAAKQAEPPQVQPGSAFQLFNGSDHAASGDAAESSQARKPLIQVVDARDEDRDDAREGDTSESDSSDGSEDDDENGDSSDASSKGIVIEENELDESEAESDDSDGDTDEEGANMTRGQPDQIALVNGTLQIVDRQRHEASGDDHERFDHHTDSDDDDSDDDNDSESESEGEEDNDSDESEEPEAAALGHRQWTDGAGGDADEPIVLSDSDEEEQPVPPPQSAAFPHPMDGIESEDEIEDEDLDQDDLDEEAHADVNGGFEQEDLSMDPPEDDRLSPEGNEFEPYPSFVRASQLLPASTTPPLAQTSAVEPVNELPEPVTQQSMAPPIPSTTNDIGNIDPDLLDSFFQAGPSIPGVETASSGLDLPTTRTQHDVEQGMPVSGEDKQSSSSIDRIPGGENEEGAQDEALASGSTQIEQIDASGDSVMPAALQLELAQQNLDEALTTSLDTPEGMVGPTNPVPDVESLVRLREQVGTLDSPDLSVRSEKSEKDSKEEEVAPSSKEGEAVPGFFDATQGSTAALRLNEAGAVLTGTSEDLFADVEDNSEEEVQPAETSNVPGIEAVIAAAAEPMDAEVPDVLAAASSEEPVEMPEIRVKVDSSGSNVKEVEVSGMPVLDEGIASGDLADHEGATEDTVKKTIQEALQATTESTEEAPVPDDVKDSNARPATPSPEDPTESNIVPTTPPSQPANPAQSVSPRRSPRTKLKALSASPQRQPPKPRKPRQREQSSTKSNAKDENVGVVDRPPTEEPEVEPPQGEDAAAAAVADEDEKAEETTEPAEVLDETDKDAAAKVEGTDAPAEEADEPEEKAESSKKESASSPKKRRGRGSRGTAADPAYKPDKDESDSASDAEAKPASRRRQRTTSGNKLAEVTPVTEKEKPEGSPGEDAPAAKRARPRRSKGQKDEKFVPMVEEEEEEGETVEVIVPETAGLRTRTQFQEEKEVVEELIGAEAGEAMEEELEEAALELDAPHSDHPSKPAGTDEAADEDDKDQVAETEETAEQDSSIADVTMEDEEQPGPSSGPSSPSKTESERGRGRGKGKASGRARGRGKRGGKTNSPGRGGAKSKSPATTTRATRNSSRRK